MLLKRIYKKDDLERFQKEKDAVAADVRAAYPNSKEPILLEIIKEEWVKLQPPMLDYISLANTGTTPQQNFSTQLVTEGLQTGLMEMHDDELFFKVHPETLKYKIVRQPGRYCLHCSEKLADDQGGEMARLHVAMKHKGLPSPVASEPAGYVWITYFECVLDKAQHEKYRIKAKARAPFFPLKKEAAHG